MFSISFHFQMSQNIECFVSDSGKKIRFDRSLWIPVLSLNPDVQEDALDNIFSAMNTTNITIGKSMEGLIPGSKKLFKSIRIPFCTYPLRPLSRSEERRVGKDCRG